MKKRRRWGFLLGLILVLLLLAIVPVMLLVRQASVQREVVAYFSTNQIGALELEPAGIAFPAPYYLPALKWNEVRIRAGNQKDHEVLAELETVTVQPDFQGLFSGRSAIRRVGLQYGRLSTEWAAYGSPSSLDELISNDGASEFTLFMDSVRLVSSNAQDSYQVLVRKATLDRVYEPTGEYFKLSFSGIWEKMVLGGTQFLADKPFDIKAIARYLSGPSLFSISGGVLRPGVGKVNFSGWMDAKTPAYAHLQSTGELEGFLALLPEPYAHHLLGFKHDGELQWNCDVRGYLNTVDHPSLSMDVIGKELTFSPPGNDSLVQALSFEARVSNGEKSQIASSRLHIDTLSLQLKNRNTRMRMKVANFRKPKIALDGEFDMNLGDFQRFLPIPGVDSICGDFAGNFFLDEFQPNTHSPQELTLLGVGIYTDSSTADNFFVEELTGVQKGNQFNFDPLHAYLGQDSLNAKGFVNGFTNILFARNAPVSLGVEVKSPHLNLSNWIPKDSGITNFHQLDSFNLKAQLNTTGIALRNTKTLPKGDYTFRDLQGSWAYFPLPIKNAQANMEFDGKDLKLYKGKAETNLGDFELEGDWQNFNAYSQRSGEEMGVRIRLTAEEVPLLPFSKLIKKGILPELMSQDTITEIKVSGEVALRADDELRLSDLPDMRVLLGGLSVELERYPEKITLLGGRTFTEKGNLVIQGLKGKVGKNDFQVVGRIDNIQSLWKTNSTLDPTVRITFSSQEWNLAELTTYADSNLLPWISPYEMKDVRLRVSWADSLLDLPEFSARIGNSDISGEALLHILPDSLSLTRQSLLNIRFGNANWDDLYHPRLPHAWVPDTSMKNPLRWVSFSPALRINIMANTFELDDFQANRVKAQIRTVNHRWLFLDTLSARIAEGRIKANADARITTEEEITFKGSATFANLRPEQLTSTFKLWDWEVVPADHLFGATRGTLRANVMYDMNDRLQPTTSDVLLDMQMGPGALQAFPPMTALYGQAGLSLPDSLSVNKLSVIARLQPDTFAIRILQADTKRGYLEMKGQHLHSGDYTYEAYVPKFFLAPPSWQTLLLPDDTLGVSLPLGTLPKVSGNPILRRPKGAAYTGLRIFQQGDSAVVKLNEDFP
ncbi:MAG: hypothetical protein AAGI38_12375 [Bacteroidota bacterium]